MTHEFIGNFKNIKQIKDDENTKHVESTSDFGYFQERTKVRRQTTRKVSESSLSLFTFEQSCI